MRDANENKKMYELLQKGYSHQEIADVYGISRQAVHQRMTFYKRKVEGIRGHNFNINDIVWQGIYDWFKENYYESLFSFCSKVYGYCGKGTSVKIRGFLVGKHDTFFSTQQIKRLCEITGKTFEELFKRREI